MGQGCFLPEVTSSWKLEQWRFSPYIYIYIYMITLFWPNLPLTSDGVRPLQNGMAQVQKSSAGNRKHVGLCFSWIAWLWSSRTSYRLSAKLEDSFFEKHYSPERHKWLQNYINGYENLKMGLTDALWDIRAFNYLMGVMFEISVPSNPV